MSPEAQRIAIAEACGWTKIRECTCKVIPRGTHTGKDADGHLPDYLSDLNAMHEAEKGLTIDQQGPYTTELITVCKRAGAWAEGSSTCLNWFWHATAAQRAEAFLRTIGKWEG